MLCPLPFLLAPTKMSENDFSSELDDLRTHLFELPQELFDLILSLTFSVPLGTSISLSSSYRPPAITQVSRSTRSRLVMEYYLENQFDPRTNADVYSFPGSLPVQVREAVRRQMRESWGRAVREYWRERGLLDVGFVGLRFA